MRQAASVWPSSGFALLERDARGRLRVTDDFLRAWLERPELKPVAESCDHERRLYEAACADPRLPITPVTLLRLRDRDAQDNWSCFVRFRDHLLAHATLEDAYFALFLRDAVPLAPLFVDRLAQLVVQNMLDGTADPLWWRAGELFFRPQRVSLIDGAVLLADAATVELRARGEVPASLEDLARAAAAGPRAVELEVLDAEKAERYFQRAEQHEFVLDLTFGRPGLDALCRLLERWIGHFLGIGVSIQPLAQVRDQHWRWHVGLDSESTAILNALYQGEEVSEARLGRLLSLFRLEVREPEVFVPDMRGRPVYLGLAADERGMLRLKPQNLLVNLPLRTGA